MLSKLFSQAPNIFGGDLVPDSTGIPEEEPHRPGDGPCGLGPLEASRLIRACAVPPVEELTDELAGR